MSRSDRHIDELRHRFNDEKFIRTNDRFERWCRDMQSFETELSKKQCPRCQSLYSLQPVSITEYICTKCNYTGFISMIK